MNIKNLNQFKEKSKIKIVFVYLLIFSFLIFIVSCQPTKKSIPLKKSSNNSTKSVQKYSYTVINTYPHDPKAYTQGLVYDQGFLYEGTGLIGQSSIRKVELETGKILKQIKIPDEYFGEGITIKDNKIIQLTWQSKKGFIYDKKNFNKIDEFNYPIEGWGITHDGSRFIMSDGTSKIYFLNSEDLHIDKSIEIKDGDKTISQLNELEFIKGEIYANIWQTDQIAKISTKTGKVTGWIDLTGLLKKGDSQQPVDVLNGIAYDSQKDRLFVTGKLWPKLFEIKLIKEK